MANKNRISGRSSRGSDQDKVGSELPMAEQAQNVEEQSNAEHQIKELQVHEETGQEQAQQEEQVLVKEEPSSTEAVKDNSEEKPIIQEEQEIGLDEQVNGEQQQEAKVQPETIINDVNSQEQQELNESKEERPFAIEDIVKPGKFGVTNSQMIPAIKRVIADGSVEKLRMLRYMYLYSFENSLKYLKKSEREFIQNNLK